MTTKRDLEAEYKKDTGFNIEGNTSNDVTFEDWVLEKYIELRDTKMEIDNG